MYPPTHFFAGWLLAGFFSSRRLVAFYCALAAVLPDVPVVLTILCEQYFEMGDSVLFSALVLAVEITHSVFVCGLFWFLCKKELWSPAIILGWASHITIDILTHGGPNFAHLYPSYTWPANVKLSHWLGFWEYRYATHLVIEQGVFGVKPFEVFLCLLLMGLVLQNWKRPGTYLFRKKISAPNPLNVQD